MSYVGRRFSRSMKLIPPKIMPIIERIKKYEQVVDRMALVEHMNEVNRVQSGTILRTILIHDLNYDLIAVERREKIFEWLSPPDHSLMHNSISEKRQEKTGAWFIKDERYKEWKMGSNSFLWLHGSGL